MFKTVKKEDPGNYRLVSFTFKLRKVIQYLILESITKHRKSSGAVRISSPKEITLVQNDNLL